jgi:hypothetical protein
MRWERGFGQACRIPNQLLYKLESEERGCFIAKFSNSGRLNLNNLSDTLLDSLQQLAPYQIRQQ